MVAVCRGRNTTEASLPRRSAGLLPSPVIVRCMRRSAADSSSEQNPQRRVLWTMHCKSSRGGDAEAAERDISIVGPLEADCDGGEPPLERAGPRADAPGSGVLAP